MAKITFNGTEIDTNGDLPALNQQAPAFSLVNSKLENIGLENYRDKKKVLNIFPSIDTPVCAISTKKFNGHAVDKTDIVFLMISADLPFAASRFCTENNTGNITTLSMMRSRQFARDYGLLIENGLLAGLTARAVVVIDENDKIIHTELVSAIENEPNYDAALAVL